MENMMLREALRLSKMGLSVIPLKPKSKEPLIPWAEFQKRRATEEELQKWWRENPAANVGVVTGTISGIAVVDLDGAEGINEASTNGLKSSLVSLTGGGKHLWYRNADVRNSVKKLPGIDVRGEGGYCVAPPSVHPRGMRYRWLNPVTSIGTIQSLPSFPKTLLEYVQIQNVKDTLQESWIADALEEMKNGHVHNTLISVLGKFRHHGFSVEDTFKLLQPHAYEDGKPYEGLRGKIEEIWERYEAKPEVNFAESQSIEVFLGRESKVEWLVSPFFAKPSLGFIVGLPEALKSWAAIDLAIELSRGGKWFGKFQTQKSRVLYIDQERSFPETQRRFKEMLNEKGIDRNMLKGELYIDCGTHRKIDMDTSYESFNHELMRIKPDAIIVDSFVTFHTKPENDRMEIQKVLDRLKLIREKFGCSTIFINHESKQSYQDERENNAPSAGRMVGSIGVVAAADSVLSIKKVNQNSADVYHTKSSQIKAAESFTFNVIDTTKGIKVEVLNG